MKPPRRRVVVPASPSLSSPEMLMKPITILCLSLAAGVAAPLGAAAPPQRLTPQEVADSVRSCMDTKADPCQDFYRYACGGWLDTAKIPGDYPEWDRGFAEITERN